MTARREYEQGENALRAKLQREQRPWAPQEREALRAHWEAALDEAEAASRRGVVSAGDAIVFPSSWRPPAWELIELEFAPAPGEPPVPDPQPHRPVKPVSIGQARHLEKLLDRRAADPHNGALTRRAIENQTGLSAWKVRRGMDLHALGWPLAVSTPDLPPKPPSDDGVYWPDSRKALQLLNSGHVRRHR